MKTIETTTGTTVHIYETGDHMWDYMKAKTLGYLPGHAFLREADLETYCDGLPNIRRWGSVATAYNRGRLTDPEIRELCDAI